MMVGGVCFFSFSFPIDIPLKSKQILWIWGVFCWFLLLFSGGPGYGTAWVVCRIIWKSKQRVEEEKEVEEEVRCQINNKNKKPEEK